MTEGKDYLGDQLRRIERAREDMYFRQLDQELIDKMRHQETEAEKEETRLQNAFSPILVPVDFSTHAAQALLRAADLAERFGSSIIVLHVIPRDAGERVARSGLEERGLSIPASSGKPGAEEVSSEVIETIMAEHREQIYTDLLEFLPARLARYSIELRVVVGHPFERIVETALSEQVALIVLGTHGRTGLSRVLMGSVAERVARLAPCPVMMVRAPDAKEQGWLQELYDQFMSHTSK